ncbi:hypothetical protein [Eubacterium sp.]|uniref:hypothetical protein n=1 Tax=Eubacterium sp. TaxID=142586 RepID=UPI002FC839DA
MESRNTLSKNGLMTGLCFLLGDVLIALVCLGFVNYLGMPSFVATLLRHCWAFFLLGGFALILVGVLAFKQYELIRCSLFEGVLLMLLGVWFGFSRVYLIYQTPNAGVSLLFGLASGLLIAFMVLIHIDMLWRAPIKRLLTTDKHTKRKASPSKGPEAVPKRQPKPQQTRQKKPSPVQSTRKSAPKSTASSQRAQTAKAAGTQKMDTTPSPRTASEAMRQANRSSRPTQARRPIPRGPEVIPPSKKQRSEN